MKRGKKKVSSNKTKKISSKPLKPKKIQFPKKIVLSIFTVGIIAFAVWLFFFRIPGPLVDDYPGDFIPRNYSDENNEPPVNVTPPKIYTPPASSGSSGSSGGSSGGTTKPPINSVTGEDSDNGLYYFTIGTCSDYTNKFTVTDTCLTDRTLREFEYAEYDGKKGCYYVDKYCPSEGSYSCLNGACVPFKAYDTDGQKYSKFEGHNLYVKGTCTDVYSSHEETCEEDIGINEWYIDGDYCATLRIYCKYGCANGACLEQATDPYLITGTMNCDKFCKDNNFENGNLPGQGPCETQIAYKEYSCCCNGEIPSTPETSCSDTCKNLGYTNAKLDANTQTACDSLEGNDYAQADYVNDCCCYFIPYDEDGNGTIDDYTLKSNCYHNTTKTYEDSCTNSQMLQEKSLLVDIYNYISGCYFKPINCTQTLGTNYICSDGACVKPITTCTQYCTSLGIRGITSGTCKIGRGTGETLCSASGLQYVSGGDYTCDSGFCCCG